MMSTRTTRHRTTASTESLSASSWQRDSKGALLSAEYELRASLQPHVFGRKTGLDLRTIDIGITTWVISPVQRSKVWRGNWQQRRRHIRGGVSEIEKLEMFEIKKWTELGLRQEITFDVWTAVIMVVSCDVHGRWEWMDNEYRLGGKIAGERRKLSVF